MNLQLLALCLAASVAPSPTPNLELSTVAYRQGSAEEMLAAIREVKAPKWDPSFGTDGAKRNEFLTKVAAANQLRRDRILAFAKAFPTHAQTVGLLQRRWREMVPTTWPPEQSDIDAVFDDIDRVSALIDTRDVLRTGKFVRAEIKLRLANGNPDLAREAAEEFVGGFPEDLQGAGLLNLAANLETDVAKKRSVLERIAQGFEHTPAATLATGKILQLDTLGKPFDFRFVDFQTKQLVEAKQFKGKVVLVDFWATWSGPCLAERPALKKLLVENKAKGLVIVSMNLDAPDTEGGKKALNDFLVKNPTPWPMNYLGKGLASEFSLKWGVDQIPTKFLIDRKGNLVEVLTAGPYEDKVLALLK